jgi:hypothetical protein
MHDPAPAPSPGKPYVSIDGNLLLDRCISGLNP